MSPKARENLLRFLRSTNPRHHDLALKMLEGMPPQAGLDEWLYQDFYTGHIAEREEEGLFGSVSEGTLLTGKLLSYFFRKGNPRIVGEILADFSDEGELWLPHTTDTHIPPAFAEHVRTVRVLRWQDGNLRALDSRVFAFAELERLDLRRQPISHISPHIAALPKLREVRLISTSFVPPELSGRRDVEIITEAPY